MLAWLLSFNECLFSIAAVIPKEYCGIYGEGVHSRKVCTIPRAPSNHGKLNLLQLFYELVNKAC